MVNNQSSLLWYDYETLGINPRRDRVVQFAAIRTDMALNIISDPIDLFCQPAWDTLADPQACLVTGISPLFALKNGLPEADFAQRIFDEMARPNTCTVGYNSIRFDDEFSRFLFYRNLFDPYQREWKHGNSRWDLLDVVRMTWALKPETLNWPVDDGGVTRFKLEQLTALNGIGHEKAHDAVSDVKATICLAQLIKNRQPELYDYAYSLRLKANVSKQLDTLSRKPVLHFSGRFPVAQGCMAMVSPIMPMPGNPNAIICFNVSQSPEALATLSAEDIQKRLFSTQADLEAQGLTRIGLKVIHINKSPMVVPAKMLTPDVAARFGHDIAQMQAHYDALVQMPDIATKLSAVYAREPMAPGDVDGALYDGFVKDSDRRILDGVRKQPAFSQSIGSVAFQDERLPELLFRYWCRNWPDEIPEREMRHWKAHCQRALSEADYGPGVTAQQILDALPELKLAHPDRVALLDDIDQWVREQCHRVGLNLTV